MQVLRIAPVQAVLLKREGRSFPMRVKNFRPRVRIPSSEIRASWWAPPYDRLGNPVASNSHEAKMNLGVFCNANILCPSIDGDGRSSGR